MSFTIYIVGFIILIVGLGIGANMMNVPPRWIAVGSVVMAGIAILSAVKNTRPRDSSN